MDRRSFLTAPLAFSLANVVQAWQPQAAGRVTSEMGRLTRVLMHEPGPEAWKTLAMLSGDHSMLTYGVLRDEVVDEHRTFVGHLQNHGVEVLQFVDLLDDALAAARKSAALPGWLRANAPALLDQAPTLTAKQLIGRDDSLVYRRDERGLLKPLVSPTTSLFFTRDLATATPAGIVLANFGHPRRRLEARLTEFLFRYAPALATYPIAFDAAEEKVFLEGGDLMVFDENTLLLGVGNASERQAAIRLAQKLERDVIAVQMPSYQAFDGEWEGLREIFYHLDCLISLVDRRRVLATPYLLEEKYSRRNPLLDVLVGFAQLEGYTSKQRLALLDEVRSVGQIVRYQAGSGEADERFGSLKLVDWLRAQGFQIIPLGGLPQAEESELKHVMESVVREARFLGANLLATAPGQAIAYAGSPRTDAALRAAEIKLTTFAAPELVRANGGPHCLTMPLEREPLAP